ncbi:rubrerythrin family protein [Halolamina salifodinae]|uniref:Rubrerythrin n=1 Tax=Halolamina salifodinae TaxID=1202767 RepID=A0A8T4GVE6_9EURY|nr:rubrerythrin family protein [Halolamina salifodinae]MBP1985664.1 rubrerythrin [Halolamina salifodinae]
MDGATLRKRVVADKRDALARLADSELLLALADGNPSPRRVLEAAADSEHAAHRTFAQWAEDEPNDHARDLFEAVAAREAEHRERVLAAMDGEYEPRDGGALHRYLRGREGAVVRTAAGTLGRGLVADHAHAQVISYFEERGDSARASLFRLLREETEAGTERGLDLLETLCADETDRADAHGVAGYTVQIAVDDYADALERGRGDAGR